MLSVSLLVALVAGCPGGSTSTTVTTGGGATKQEIDDRCEILLSSMHDTFQLQKLGQTTTLGDGVQRLNDWQQSCAPGAPPADPWPEALDKLLTDEQRESIKSTRFTIRDGEHVQDGVLFRSLARYACGPEGADLTDLQRAATAFQHVVRAIELNTVHPADLPMTPYEIYLVGKGTASDRAWIFADLLRELKIDAVLIAPPLPENAPKELSGEFLVGVLLEGQVYLFDPKLGVPVPGPGAVENPGQGPSIATLEQAATDAAVLRQLDFDENRAYPLKAADLEHPTVWLITHSGLWSDRMRVVQRQFSGENSMVLADPLQDTDGAPGLWSRVEKVGDTRWSGEKMRIWAYPEAQIAGRADLNEDQKRAMQVVWLPFSAFRTLAKNDKDEWILVDRERVADPSAGDFDPGRRVAVRRTAGAQMRARLAHLSGDFKQAVQAYREVFQRCIRLMPDIPQSQGEEIFRHLRAIDDALFWTALCKFEQGEFRVAIDSLEIYRRKFPNDVGAWSRQGRYLMALSHAAQGEYEAAMSEFDNVKPDDPEFLGYQWLILQWQAALQTSQRQPPAGPGGG